MAECEDIAEALQLTPNEFCEFKAIWRTAAARLGNGKPDHKCLYDAEKRLHYAGRDVEKYKRALAEPEGGWITHTGSMQPVQLRDDEVVEVTLKNGNIPPARPAEQWIWTQASGPTAITKWRRAP